MHVVPLPGFTDPFSSISHLLAAFFFLILGVKLILSARGHTGWIVANSVFVFTVVFLLSMSGVYHLLDTGTTGRAVLQRLDHAGIFALIAGTFTPIHSILFKGFLRWGILFLIWATAITGITLKSIFFTQMAEWLGLILYLGLGWLGILSAYLTHRLHGFTLIKPLAYGAIAYTIGASFEFLSLPTLIPMVIGPHELFHLAVILGIAWHWQFIKNLMELKRGQINS
ncbi:MAG: hemolysin III family protein [Thioalkalispiraceae bacterium]|jgi:channel protein (hemolysin III family)